MQKRCERLHGVLQCVVGKSLRRASWALCVLAMPVFGADVALRDPAATSRPPYRALQQDPVGGMAWLRISGKDEFGGATGKHVYAKHQPWNADGSLLLLAGWPYQLLDGRNFKRLGSWFGPAQAVWSNRDPYRAYGVRSEPSAFVTGDPRVNWSFERSPLRLFPEYDSLDLGGGEGNLSADDGRVALFGRDAGGTDLLLYDIAGNSVLARRRFDALVGGAGGDIDNVTVSPSGHWVVAQIVVPFDGHAAGTWQFNERLQPVRRLSARFRAHGDVGIDTDGNEIWLMPAETDNNAIHSIRLADGRRRLELAASAAGGAGHLSCRNLRRPGWCYVSGHARVDGPPSDARAASWRAVLAVHLDGRGEFTRLVDTRHASPIADREYERAPMAVPDRDGRRVLWASDWGNARPDAPVNVYVSGPFDTFPASLR